MKSIPILADFDHPLVRETAERLTEGATTVREKLEKLFYYVRDNIEFFFPDQGDLVKASDTITLGKGQCNTKGTLFLALCKAAGIHARIHFSLIKKEIQRGLFTKIGYWLMPDLLSHSWIEVDVDGRWRRIDSYINDEAFYRAGKSELMSKGWDTGYSISCSSGESNISFTLDEEKFVQMDAVVGDHGVWDEPSVYYETDLYKNRPNALTLVLYRLLIGRVNKRVEHMRKGHAKKL